MAGPNPSVIVGMPSFESWVRFLKPAPPGTKMSAWRGRSAPADSLSVITGSRLRADDLVERGRSCQRRRVRRAAAIRHVGAADRELDALDDADPAHHAGADRILRPPRRQRAQLEERRVRIDERFDPLAHEHLAAGAVAVDVALAADRRHRRQLLLDLGPQRAASRRGSTGSRRSACRACCAAPDHDRWRQSRLAPCRRLRPHIGATIRCARTSGRTRGDEHEGRGPMSVRDVASDLLAEHDALDADRRPAARRRVGDADAEPGLEHRRPDRAPHLLRRHRRAGDHRSRRVRGVEGRAVHIDRRRRGTHARPLPGDVARGAARGMAREPTPPRRRRRHARRRHAGGVVRTVDGRQVVRDGAADGDVGARPGHRRHGRRRPTGDRPAAPRRPDRVHHPRLVVRQPWPRAAGRAGVRGAHGTVGCDVDVGSRRRRRSRHGSGGGLLPRRHPAATRRRHRAATSKATWRREWLLYAQAFAGAATDGPPPRAAS